MRTEGEPSRRKDVDQAARTHVLRAFAWSLAGAFAGAMAGAVGRAVDAWGVGTMLLLTVGTWAAAFLLPLTVSAISGRAAGQLYNPSGRSTPHRKEYSQAESLVASGRYGEAVAAFERAITEDASEPIPYLKIARVYRDGLERYEESARWFKRALADSTMPAGLFALTVRELVELYVLKLGQPRRAAPILARLAEERRGTPEGEWAVGELRRVKASVPEESE